MGKVTDADLEFNDDADDLSLPEPGDDISVDSDGDDAKLEVEVVDDTPERDRKAQRLEEEVADPTEEELEQYSAKVRARIAKLTHARHDERRERERLAREHEALANTARQLMLQNQQLQQYVQTGAGEYAKVSTEAAEAAVAAAKAKLKKAKDDYDTEAEVDALDELQTARLRLEQAKNFRAPDPQPVVQHQQNVVQQQQFSQDDGIDPKTRQWMSRNTWFTRPGFEDVTSFALGLHKKLVDSGVDPRSDAYFERIDTQIKAKFPEVVGEADDETPALRPQRKAASAVSAPTRGAGPKRIRLTQSQVAMCRTLGITPEQYTQQLLKEGQNA
jgi:hypothetical protein